MKTTSKEVLSTDNRKKFLKMERIIGEARISLQETIFWGKASEGRDETGEGRRRSARVLLGRL